jgi:hypothetical protein
MQGIAEIGSGSYLSTDDTVAMNPRHHESMAKRSAAKRNFMEVAQSIVELAIREQMDGKPLAEPEPDKRNPHAVALGSIGDKRRAMEGKEVAGSPSKGIAKKAARSRWGRQ